MKKIISIILALIVMCCSTFAEVKEERRILRQGCKGEDVSILQERLQELGFLNDIPDGVYGKNTENAVAAFQEEAGIVVNGIADIETQDAILFRIEEPSYVFNTSSKKFHLPSCNGVATMSDIHKKLFYGTREEAVDLGYSPCGMCNP